MTINTSRARQSNNLDATLSINPVFVRPGEATEFSKFTLPVQIIANHPRRRHSGCFSACSISCNEGLPDMERPS